MFKCGRGVISATVSTRRWGGLVLAVLFWVASPVHLFASDVADVAEQRAPSPVPAAELNPTLAEVNGVPIYAAKVETILTARLPKATGHGVVSAERLLVHRNQIIRELVVAELIRQAAKQAGITASEAEIDAEVAVLEQRFPSRAAYLRGVAAQGLDAERIREELHDYVLESKMRQRNRDQVVAPGDAELKTYYDEHLDKFVIPAQAEVSYLMLKVDPTSSSDVWDAAKARLSALRERMLAGSGFQPLAKEAAKTGAMELRSLGRVHQGQVGIQALDKAAFAMAPGEISEPVWTLYGYGLVVMSARQDARQMAFDELNRELFAGEWLEAKQQQVLKDWVVELVGEADLKFSE